MKNQPRVAPAEVRAASVALLMGARHARAPTLPLFHGCSILAGWLMIVPDLLLTACSLPGWTVSPPGTPSGAPRTRPGRPPG